MRGARIAHWRSALAHGRGVLRGVWRGIDMRAALRARRGVAGARALARGGVARRIRLRAWRGAVVRYGGAAYYTRHLPRLLNLLLIS